MKAKELSKLLLKNPESDVFFNSPIASPDSNIPVGDVYENRIKLYTFSDGKTYSYIPLQLQYMAEEAVSLTDKVATVLTDKIR